MEILKRFDIGKMNHLITVNQNTPTRSASGAASAAWTQRSQLWAYKDNGSSFSDDVEAGKPVPISKTVFIVHGAAVVDVTDRIVDDNGETFEIVDVSFSDAIGKNGLKIIHSKLIKS